MHGNPQGCVPECDLHQRHERHERHETARRAHAGRHALVIVLAANMGLGFALPAPGAQAAEARELSSSEQAELRAGKLVVRRVTRRLHGVPMVGGMSWQLVRADADEVYAALTDVDSYRYFLPAVDAVRLLEDEPPFTLFVQHRLGFLRASYCVRTQRDATQRTLRFRMDPRHPSAIRDAWGELRVTPYSQDTSVVSLAMLADLGEGPVLAVMRESIQTWMLRVPALIKRHLEKVGRNAALF